MSLLFIAAVTFCVYTYVLFPVWLELRVRWLRRRMAQADRVDPLVTSATGRYPAVEAVTGDQLPTVSIVIAAHNERDRLPLKVDSLDALDYPRAKLQVVFVSDGSTDGTLPWLVEQCAARAGWQVEHYAIACGKPTALNTGVRACEHDVLVFMDARQPIARDALRALVPGLRDPAVGVVSGELVLDPGERGERSVALYWHYEKWIRHNESRLFSTTGATGALFAMRRAQYSQLPADTLLDDFDTPIKLLGQGLRTCFEPAARTFDVIPADPSRELHRKTRTLAGNLQSFRRHPWLFDPRRNPVWWQFVSHKVFRLLVPYALILALLASLAGDSIGLRIMLLVQVLAYGAGVASSLGWLDNPWANFMRTFLQLNAAAVLGVWRFCSGTADVRWKSDQKSAHKSAMGPDR